MRKEIKDVQNTEILEILESAAPFMEKYGFEVVSIKEEYVKPTILKRILEWRIWKLWQEKK